MSFDFIDGWMDWSACLRSPPILRLWAGVGILSSVLNRHVWLRANSRFPPLFPNLFIMLVAPPRVGKDMAINAAARICAEANKQAKERFGHPILHFGGHSISPKGLIDLLKDALLSDTTTNEYHSLSFFIPELTTAMPDYNSHLIGILNELWNCNPRFGEKIRGIEYTIKNPHITLLMGNQPGTLFNIFPEQVFQMGFTARVFFIYSQDRVKKRIYLEPHEEERMDDGLEQQLINHLVDLSQWSGQLKTDKGFRDAVSHFDEHDPCPVPGSRFVHWNGGRGLNLQKLSICIAASEKSQIVTLKHWERALEYLFEAEKQMPRIFENVVTDRGFSEELEKLPKLVGSEGIVTQHKLLTELARTRPPHEAGNIINQAIKAGILQLIYDEAGAPTRPPRYTVGSPKKGHILQ